MQLFRCMTCGGTLERRGDEYVCPFCSNVYAADTFKSPESEDLTQAFNLRQTASFDAAAKIYEKIIKNYPDADLSEAFWGLFLCEQQVLFEEDGQGVKFPSFYGISDVRVQESSYLKKVKALYPTMSESKKLAYESESEKIATAKQLYNRIAVTTEPYDVFICFKSTNAEGTGKTKDYEIAQNIYNEFIKDYNIFFSERTLESLTTREYEPNIYRGLYTAKVLLLMCSKTEYIQSQWLKNEWSRYLAFNKGNKEKCVIPVFIDGFRPESLPKELKSYQGVNADIKLMKRLAEVMKNVIKPVDKIAELAEKQRAEIERLQEQQRKQMEELTRQQEEQLKKLENMRTAAPVQSGSAASVATLLELAQIQVENGQFDEAEETANAVLKQQPKSAEAWYYKLLAQCKTAKLSRLMESDGLEKNANYKNMLRFMTDGDAALKTILETAQQEYLSSPYYLNLLEQKRKREEAQKEAKRQEELKQRAAEKEAAIAVLADDVYDVDLEKTRDKVTAFYDAYRNFPEELKPYISRQKENEERAMKAYERAASDYLVNAQFDKEDYGSDLGKALENLYKSIRKPDDKLRIRYSNWVNSYYDKKYTAVIDTVSASSKLGDTTEKRLKTLNAAYNDGVNLRSHVNEDLRKKLNNTLIENYNFVYNNSSLFKKSKSFFVGFWLKSFFIRLAIYIVLQIVFLSLGWSKTIYNEWNVFNMSAETAKNPAFIGILMFSAIALSIIFSVRLKISFHFPNNGLAAFALWFLFYGIFAVLFVLLGFVLFAALPITVFLIFLPFSLKRKRTLIKSKQTAMETQAVYMIKLAVMDLVKMDDAVRFLDQTSAKQFLKEWLIYKKPAYPYNVLTQKDLNKETESN